ncbi:MULTISPECIES: hypothetical protein [Bacillaceae]|uniref:DUF4386 family protein n=1 Tax=Aliibacillus thermotolerans TaxID=1834418 RepID=A0ABW0U4E5_9BACI|nr:MULTISPECIES: hypothetical protein [Bacillaceae]NMB18425.1 hypothetical protein [Erysipelothrix sp.]MBU8791378.1 hypothetical protein [Oceanobacillus caeni]MDA3129863.1 hypothetical protein [Aliibacillus thermotolerans]MDF1510992.1 hypothetical protein [Robertmurraya sp. DFI.2.37]MED4475468.1 hypothetical protein [Oceanobacillus caeni]
MAIASKLTAIGIIALSFAVGFLSFYLLSDLTREQKKLQVEEIISQLFNFVIFIWIGKILINLSTFISDPLSILAYPSDSKSFYFAIVSIALMLLYKSKQKNMQVIPLLDSFVHLFLISSFVYEFIQFVVVDNFYALGYLILLSILIAIFFLLRERFTTLKMLTVIVIVWSIGMLILGFVQPFVTVFGYIMAPWFVGLFLVMSVGILTYKIRRGAT